MKSFSEYILEGPAYGPIRGDRVAMQLSVDIDDKDKDKLLQGDINNLDKKPKKKIKRTK